MVIFDSPKKKLRKSKETETAEKTKDAITTSPEKAKIMESKVNNATAHEWQDETSRKVEERLMEKGIRIPWHYNDTFGDSKVLALRAGGVGAVFFVKSTLFGERIYAAKTLQRFLQRDYFEMPTYQQKKIADDFLEEALPWLKMGQHPNIVPVHLLENIVHPTTRRNVPFVFSEFMEGGDLKNLLVEKGRFDLEEALSVGLQVCEALLHTYKHGLSAHKDLKPENIMVYKEGIYKVTDFSAGMIGTPGYMAPEQVASIFGLKASIAIDQRADQFAMGIIMLELILGEHPFPQIKRRVYSKEEAEKFFRVGVGKIPDNLSSSLKEVIAKCLTPDPANRFSGLLSLKEALLEVYKTEFGEYHFPRVEIDDSPIWWFSRGWSFRNIGRYDAAEMPFKEALERFKAISRTKSIQGMCIVNLGCVYRNTGKYSDAEEKFKDALGIFEGLPGNEGDLALCLLNLGNVYHETGRYLDAEEKYKKALSIFEVIRGTEAHQARCLMGLGNVYLYVGKYSDAEEMNKEALRIFESIPGNEIEQARCLTNLGGVYLRVNKYSDAEKTHKEALKIFRAIPRNEIEQTESLAGLGNVYHHVGRYSDAEAMYKEALRIFEANPESKLGRAKCLGDLGSLYLSIYKYSDAEAMYKEALRIFGEIPGSETDQAICLSNLGYLYVEVQEFNKAREVLEKALMICKLHPSGTEKIKNKCLQLLSLIS